MSPSRASRGRGRKGCLGLPLLRECSGAARCAALSGSDGCSFRFAVDLERGLVRVGGWFASVVEGGLNGLLRAVPKSRLKTPAYGFVSFHRRPAALRDRLRQVIRWGEAQRASERREVTLGTAGSPRRTGCQRPPKWPLTYITARNGLFARQARKPAWTQGTPARPCENGRTALEIPNSKFDVDSRNPSAHAGLSPIRSMKFQRISRARRATRAYFLR
jgi:hypothetical protein